MRDLQILIEDPHTIYTRHRTKSQFLRVLGVVKVADELPLTSGTPWACFCPNTDDSNGLLIDSLH